jgi:hypothetical protein
MSNNNLNPGEVKSICDKLEISPSQHDAHGHHGGKPNVSPTAKSGESVVSGTHLKTHTGEFNKTDRGRALPNFKGQYAKKAEQV